MSDYESRVRVAAYHLWEAEGRPDGRGEIHWQMAEIAIAVLGYLKQSQRRPFDSEEASLEQAKAACIFMAAGVR